jgi:hypothetical protein
VIVSASYRTDIPAFYATWFRRRLAAGFAMVASPYGGPPYRVGLGAGAVDGFVLWTRNIAPLEPHLSEIAARAPFIVQYTVTGYPRALEAATPPAEAAIARIHALARCWGGRAAVWRYDPIVISDLTPPSWHESNFATFAAAIAGATDEVIVSFMSPYRKTARNLDAAARRHGFAWRDPEPAEKRALLCRLAAIAAAHGIGLSLCTQPELAIPGAGAARCVDATRLSDVAGRPLAARDTGHRPGCLCAESRDIGAYDTCPQGCVYCYAVARRERALQRCAAHDPEAESLGDD